MFSHGFLQRRNSPPTPDPNSGYANDDSVALRVATSCAMLREWPPLVRRDCEFFDVAVDQEICKPGMIPGPTWKHVDFNLIVNQWQERIGLAQTFV